MDRAYGPRGLDRQVGVFGLPPIHVCVRLTSGLISKRWSSGAPDDVLAGT